jgi:hypothetical protein
MRLLVRMWIVSLIAIGLNSSALVAAQPVSSLNTGQRWVNVKAGIDHANASTSGSLAWTLAQIPSSARTDVVLRGHRTYQLNGSLTCPENINLVFQRGAVLQRGARSDHLTINGTMEGPRSQRFADNSTNHDWVVLSPVNNPEVYPELWGCVADNSTSCGPSIISAINAGRVVSFGQGTYRIASGGLHLTSANNGQALIGKGSLVTELYFSDSSVDHLIHVSAPAIAGLRISGLTATGPGLSSGTVDGIYASGLEVGVCGYDWQYDDVIVQGVSRDGIYSTCAFQQRFMGVSARDCGRDGIVIGGDQSPTFIGSGNWMYGIGRWALWFTGGRPFIQGINMGGWDATRGPAHAIKNGMKFGSEEDDPGGWNYATPTIDGVNMEPIDDNGTGMLFCTGSSPATIQNILIWATGTHVKYGIRLKYLMAGFMFGNSVSFGTTKGGSFDHRWYVDGVWPGKATIAYWGESRISEFNEVAQNYLVNIMGGPPVPTYGVTVRSRKISSSTPSDWSRQLYRDNESLSPTHLSDNDTATSGTRWPDNVIEFNANVEWPYYLMYLDYASYMPGRTFTIKKTDSSSQALIVNTMPIDCIDDNATPIRSISLGAMESVTLHSDGKRWYRIGGFRP